MLTPNYGCVGATYKSTCSDTILTSLVMFFLYVDNRRTISFINSFMTTTLHQAMIEISRPRRPSARFNSKRGLIWKSLGQRARLFLAQTSLAVKKTTRTFWGRLNLFNNVLTQMQEIYAFTKRLHVYVIETELEKCWFFVVVVVVVVVVVDDDDDSVSDFACEIW